MTPNEGRVEVYYSSQWRTICHDAWDIYDAHVVCRQLGYRGAIRHHTSSYFRGVSSNIFTSHVYCTGTESYIYECSRGYGVTSFPYYCSSNTNAGVTCESLHHSMERQACCLLYINTCQCVNFNWNKGYLMLVQCTY